MYNVAMALLYLLITIELMNLKNYKMDKYTVYLTCLAFPGKVRKSIVEAANLSSAKAVALEMYPGYAIL